MSKRRGMLAITMSGADVDALAAAAINEGLVPSEPPDDAKEKQWLAAAKHQRLGEFLWDEGLAGLYFDRKTGVVQAQRHETELDDTATFDVLARLPFELLTVSRIYPEWGGAVPWISPGFADGHLTLGWACALRGKGHDRLASRRVLEQGPWRTIRIDAKDLTFVVFHDLMAPPDQALLQAQDGWDRIADTDEGAFVHSGYDYSEDLSGVHDAARGRFRVIVTRGPVKSRKMLDLAVARTDPRVQAKTPFDKVTFIYLTEEEARIDLPRLWRYGHECWAIVEGQEVRIDTDYRPADETPQWALATGR